MALNPVTKEISGVEVSIDPRATTDLRFLKAMTELMRVNQKRDKLQAKDPDKATDLTFKLMEMLEDVARMLFGSQKSVEQYQAKLAEQNDGFVGFREWLSFVMEVVNTYQKN